MIRPLALLMTALALALPPPLAGAQVFKCLDPVTGKTLYTDQPCKGGQLVVPPRTEDDIRRDAEAAARARDDALRREQAASELERQRQVNQAAQDRARAQLPQAESADCRAARAEASARAASPSATEDDIFTARYNAALACGQPPPDIVVAPRYWPRVRPRVLYGDDLARPPAAGSSGVSPSVPTPVRITPSGRAGTQSINDDSYQAPVRLSGASSR